MVLLENPDGNLPPEDYAFHEMFCNEPRCDCRRVFFSVTSSRTGESEAVIAYDLDKNACAAEPLVVRGDYTAIHHVGPVGGYSGCDLGCNVL